LISIEIHSPQISF